MAISPGNTSKRSPISSSKLRQNMKWEFKRKLAEKRLMDLTIVNKNVDSVSMDMPIVCNPPKEKSTSNLHSSVGLSSLAMELAQEVQANLSPHFPSFVRHMLRSHVTGGFWLGLPRQFCHVHLPKQDGTVVLIDENEQENNCTYLFKKNGLSAGWRGFSIAHKLLVEDVLVFQLIEPSKFKVYIVRARSLMEVDGAMSLLNLDLHVKKEDEPKGNADVVTEKTIDEYPKLLEEDDHQKKDMEILMSMREPSLNKSRDESDDFGTENVDGIRFSESLLSFKDVKGFEDFSIHVDGLIIDSEIPMHLKTKYYELCRSQNMFLHDNLAQGLNSKLAAGMIYESINIADAIRAVKPSTASDHLESWDKTLKAFEDLGMVVEFLRARIHKLLSLSRESQARIELKRTERGEAEEEMRALNVKLSNVKSRIGNIDVEINALNVINEGLSSKFKAIACAPW